MRSRVFFVLADIGIGAFSGLGRIPEDAEFVVFELEDHAEIFAGLVKGGQVGLTASGQQGAGHEGHGKGVAARFIAVDPQDLRRIRIGSDTASAAADVCIWATPTRLSSCAEKAATAAAAPRLRHRKRCQNIESEEEGHIAGADPSDTP